MVGAISMDVTLVDVTDSGAERGDRAVCLGSDGGQSVTAWDLARAAGTIPYEILCGIGRRVLRTYAEGPPAGAAPAARKAAEAVERSLPAADVSPKVR